MSATLELAKQLISIPSITPEDGGCQDILIKRLQNLGFTIEKLPFGKVKNFWAKRGQTQPLLVFAGHTDVVPPGPIEQWYNDPFQAFVRDGFLYGRGAADMKSSLAAMVVATEEFIHHYPNYEGAIGFLVTSDEEGDAIDGTAKVIAHLKQQSEQLTYCIVGEASSESKLGDTVKIGRRGSLSGRLIIHGIQGHIAYPNKADNAIHKVVPALKELIIGSWDQGNEFFPPTSFQISNIHAGTGANNVIPGQCEVVFNFRYSPEVNAEILQNKVNEILNKYDLNHEISWAHGAEPFLSKNNRLTNIVKESCEEICKVSPVFSTTGGTSDGRFIAKTGCEIVEIGPINESIHKINECVKIADLDLLIQWYRRILEKTLLKAKG